MLAPSGTASAPSPGEVDIDDWLRRVEARVREVLSQTEDAVLTEMAEKMVDAGGKRLRPRVGLLAYAACGGKELTPDVIDSGAGIELIHTATLVHDDIIDGGEIRRGIPSTYREYGLGSAVVAGDFLFIKGFHLTAALDKRLIALTAKACTRLAEGELLESRHVGQFSVGLDDYLQTIAKKTAAPFQASCEAGAYLAGAGEEQIEALGAYGHNLGMAFQMTDDLLDVRGGETTGKPQATDIRGGVPTLPSILTLRSAPNQRFRLLVSKPAKTEEEVREIVDAILRSGSMKEAEALVAEYVDRARAALRRVPESLYRGELLRIAADLIGRDA